MNPNPDADYCTPEVAVEECQPSTTAFESPKASVRDSISHRLSEATLEKLDDLDPKELLKRQQDTDLKVEILHDDDKNIDFNIHRKQGSVIRNQEQIELICDLGDRSMRLPTNLKDSADFVLISQKQGEDSIFNTSGDQQTSNKLAQSYNPDLAPSLQPRSRTLVSKSQYMPSRKSETTATQ